MFDNLENDLAPNLVQSVTNKSCWYCCWLLQTGADTPMLQSASTLPLELPSKRDKCFFSSQVILQGALPNTLSSIAIWKPEWLTPGKMDKKTDLFKVIETKCSCIQTPWIQYLLKSFHRHPSAQPSPAPRPPVGPPLFYLLTVISNNYLKIAAVYYFHLGDIYQVGVRRGTPPPADRGRSQDTRHVARGSGDTFKLLKALSPRLLFIGDTR